MEGCKVDLTNTVIPYAHISLWIEAGSSSSSGAIHLSVPLEVVGTDGSTKEEYPKSVSRARPSSPINTFSYWINESKGINSSCQWTYALDVTMYYGPQRMGMEVVDASCKSQELGT